VTVVVDIDDSSQGFPDTVVYDSIHANSDRILAENLLRWHIEGNCSQIHLAICVDAWQNEKDTRSTCSALT
jgi:hypothetical protein